MSLSPRPLPVLALTAPAKGLENSGSLRAKPLPRLSSVESAQRPLERVMAGLRQDAQATNAASETGIIPVTGVKVP